MATVAFVRNHGAEFVKAAGTTDTYATTALVAAGNTLFAVCVHDNAAAANTPIVSSISRPAGENATWALLLRNTYGSAATAGAFASGEVWMIKTTVDWPSATSLTFTYSASITMKLQNIVEFSGVEATQKGNVGNISSATTTAASASTTGTTPAIGDLALGFAFAPNSQGPLGGDTDTSGGSWSSAIQMASSSGNVATNNAGVLQYKILTAPNHQTYNISSGATAGNGSSVAILPFTPDPVISQAAYRFYADGTESGSTALAAQDTAPTATLTSGDVNAQLRVRLQEGNAGNVPVTDDWRLRYEKNSSGVWTDVAVPTGAEILAASYEGGVNTTGGGTYPTVGESFMGTGAYLTAMNFQLAVENVANTTIRAHLYAHTGTFGSGGTITGPPLASSTNTISDTSLPDRVTVGYAWQTFTFDGSFVMQEGVPYCAVFTAASPISNGIFSQSSSGSSAYPGNYVRTLASGVSDSLGVDHNFRVYGIPAPPVVPYISPSLDPVVDAKTTLVGTSFDEDLLTATFVAAQSFTPAVSGPLISASFRVKKKGAPTGTVKATLWVHTNTYGTNSAGTGSGLATSTARPVSDFTGTYDWYTFTFDGTVALTSGTPYVISIGANTVATSTDCLSVELDGTGTGHPGNMSTSPNVGSWTPRGSNDLFFAVRTSALATTNRLTGGTGTFTPGESSTTGLVDNLGWSKANFTEVLYALTLKAANLADADTLRFRVVRNGAALDTIAVTPTITAAKVIGPGSSPALSGSGGLSASVTPRPQRSAALSGSGTLGRSAFATIPGPLVSTLTTDFTDAAWNKGPRGITATASKLTIPAYLPSANQAYSAAYYSMENGRVFAKFTQFPSTGWSFISVIDQGTSIVTDLYSNGTMLYGSHNGPDIVDTTWDPTKPYMSIRESGDTLYWERSATGQPGTWELLGSVAIPSTMYLSTTVTLGAYNGGSESWIENFNTPAAATGDPTASPALSGTGTLGGTGGAPTVNDYGYSTGAYVTYTPPPGTTSITVEAFGMANTFSVGEKGGYAKGTLVYTGQAIRYLVPFPSGGGDDAGMANAIQADGTDVLYATNGWDNGVDGDVGVGWVDTARLSNTTATTGALSSFTPHVTFTALSSGVPSTIPGISAAPALSGSGGLSATALPKLTTTRVLSGTGTLSAAVAPRPVTATSLSGSGSLGTTTAVSSLGLAALSGSGTITATGSATSSGSAAPALSSVGTLTATFSSSLVSTATLSGSGSLNALATPRPASAASLSGTGGLGAVALPQAAAAVAFSGAGSLNSSAAPRPQTAVAFNGSGTLTASASAATSGSAAPALSGAGVLSTALVAAMTTTAALSGSGTLAATLTPRPVAAATLNGSGSLQTSAKADVAAVVGLSGVGALTAVGSASTSGSAAPALTGAGVLSTSSALSTSGTPAFAGSGTLSAARALSVSGAAALSGVGSLSASVATAGAITVALSGAGTLAGISQPKLTIPATLSGTGSLVSAPQPALAGLAGMAGTGSLSCSTALTAQGSPALSGTGVLTAAVATTGGTSVSLAGSGTLVLSTTPRASSAPALSGAGLLAAAGNPAVLAAPALTGSGVLTGSVSQSANTLATLSGAGTLSRTVSAGIGVAVSLSGSGAMTSVTLPKLAAQATFAGVGALSATTQLAQSGAAALSGSGVMTATGSGSQSGAATANFSGAGTMSAAPAPGFSATVSMSGAGVLIAGGTPAIPAIPALSGTGALIASMRTQLSTSVVLSGSSTLEVFTLPQVFGAPVLFGGGVLTALTYEGMPLDIDFISLKDVPVIKSVRSVRTEVVMRAVNSRVSVALADRDVMLKPTREGV